MPYALQFQDMDGSTRWFELNGQREVYYSMPRAKRTADSLNDDVGASIYKAVELEDEPVLVNEVEWSALTAARHAKNAERRNKVIEECAVRLEAEAKACDLASMLLFGALILRDMKSK